ncbi:MAG: phage major capsid protein [Oscillospiraceae bacterium]|nr:phage major capsid protein [Oscillospiraceae bacterium]
MSIQKTIQELREQRKNKWDEACNFLDSKSVNGVMSEENERIYDAMEQEINALKRAIQREERREKLDAELNAPTSEPIIGKPSDMHIKSRTGRNSEEYEKAFWDNLRKKKYYDVQNVLEIGDDDHGGYLVPDEYEKTLVQGLEEANFFRSVAHVIRTDSGERKIPVVADHGEAQWIDESGSYQLEDDEFTVETLTAYKLGTAIKVSEELMNDSVFNIQAYISSEFTRRIGAGEEAAFIAGNGAKKPTGVLTTAETGYTTTTAAISFDDVQELYYSLKSPYRKRASWILNDTTVKALRKLKDSNGNYLWQPSVSADIPDMIMSRPYHTSQYVPSIEAGAKVLIFGDYNYYWIAERQGKSFKRLDELFALNGQIGFIASERIDGKLILPEAVKVLQMKA